MKGSWTSIAATSFGFLAFLLSSKVYPIINPHPKRNWFFVWFIKPLRANVKGRGSNFFSITPPTIQLVSTIPRNTRLAFGKSIWSVKNFEISNCSTAQNLGAQSYLIPERSNWFLHSKICLELYPHLNLFTGFLVETQMKTSSSNCSTYIPVWSCNKLFLQVTALLEH